MVKFVDDLVLKEEQKILSEANYWFYNEGSFDDLWECYKKGIEEEEIEKEKNFLLDKFSKKIDRIYIRRIKEDLIYEGNK